MKRSLLFSLLLLITCLNPLKVFSQDESFEVFLDKFITSFNEKQTELFDTYIHSDFGFFVLDNPGAFITSSHFSSFKEIMNLEGEYNIGFLKTAKVEGKFVKGNLPHYNCDNENQEGWDKTGCFYNKTKKISVSSVYNDMINLGLGDTESLTKEKQIAEIAETNISYFAYCTEIFVGFYFGKIEGKWYLICIDKVTPCDA